MSNHDIKTRLAELRDELERTPELDEDLRDLLEEVDADIHALLESDEQEGSMLESVQERLESVATDFAARHPSTERFFQELIAALGRMGI